MHSKMFQIAVAVMSCSVSISAFAETTIQEVVEQPTSNNEAYQIQATNSAWEDKFIDQSFYDSPYQISLFNSKNGEDSDRLLSQTYSIFGLGVGVIGVLAVMPSSITNWETNDLELFSKWTNNVKSGPVWDRDDVILNYVMHPYFGGVYYQTARKSGYRQWDSFIYSTMMSTFFWEYGIEAFAEVPSFQDLVVTPVLGWVYGEWAYNTEKDIWLNGGTVLDSEILGASALFLLDPVDTFGRNFNKLFGKDIIKAGTGYFTYNEVQLPYSDKTENQIGLQVNYTFGDNDAPAQSQISGNRETLSRYQAATHDPVDFNIVGVSAGGAWINLDSKWGKESAYAYQWSLGLYFSRSFSARLNYTNASVVDTTDGESYTYENYGIDGQYYFNAQGNIRPYITAGLGEIMFDKSDDDTRFKGNIGLGLHFKINNNWAIQSDWRSYFSTHTNENHLSTSLVYRFGSGEH